MSTADIASVCVNPVSPNYLIHHRYVYYLSVALPLIYPFTSYFTGCETPCNPPLVKAAYAYALTYSGTAALYAILLLASPRDVDSLPINLDIFGVWAVLSVAGCALLAFLQWDRVLRDEKQSKTSRPIFRIWGVWITVGIICVFVALVKSKPDSEGLSALSQVDCLAMAKSQSLHFRLRTPEEVEVRDYDRIFGSEYNHLKHSGAPLMFIALFWGLLCCLFTVSSPRVTVPCKEEDCGTPSSKDERFFYLRRGYTIARRAALFCVPAYLILNIVFNEIYLQKGRRGDGGIPFAEKSYQVGQWGLPVGMSLLTVASVVHLVLMRICKSVRSSEVV
ncbi:hypothetical protein F5884DRAFT_178536 [Xylogone sp. PMI_703]|nr:hypothetical protein F5884DRAFT_178536 [Xylogone sp. PMI_703]